MKILAKCTAMAAAVIGLVAGAPAMAERIYVKAGRVIADAGEAPLGPTLIVIEDGRIVELLPVDDAGARAAVAQLVADNAVARFTDLSDKTVVPGLIDLHTHLSGDPSGEFWRAATTPPEYYTLIAAKNARITARAGFTTVRDLGSRSDQVTQSLRSATAQGLVPGPRIITSGRTIAIVGGHGDISGFREAVDSSISSGYTCTGPVECAQKVRKASKYGADLIKITATGGVLSQQGRGLEEHFSAAEMESIVETARLLGLKVAAHAHGARGIEAAAKAGVHTIEHGTYIDAAAAKAMKESGTTLVPTLMAFEGIKRNLGTEFYTPVVEAKILAVSKIAGSIIERALEYDVPIAFGTDAGVYPHGQNASEFALMVKGGMSPASALAAATTGAAKVLGMEDEIGRLAPGYSADLIAVDGDPLQDITVLEDVGFVMVRGRIID